MRNEVALAILGAFAAIPVVASAVRKPPVESVKIYGVVLDYHQLTPIANATITFGEYTAITDVSGHYSFMIPIGTSGIISCSAAGYEDGEHNWTVTESWGINFHLMPI